jgi:hypothetical protein
VIFKDRERHFLAIREESCPADVYGDMSSDRSMSVSGKDVANLADTRLWEVLAPL